MKLFRVSSQFTKELFHNRAFVERINTSVKVNTTYDVPYLAGYNKNGTIIYIDRHLKPYFQNKKKQFNVIDFLLVHEIVEKALIDICRLNYRRAHHIATHIEHLVVKNHKINWWHYLKFLKSQIKTINSDKLKRIPPDLDLTSYKDEYQQIMLQKISQINNPSIISNIDTDDWKEDIVDKHVDLSGIIGTDNDN